MPAAAQAVDYLGHAPVIAGNRARLLVDGKETYPAMLDSIGRAERCIAFESYIFAGDSTGKRFRDALIDKARAGVAVRVLVDGIGTYGTPLSFWEPLREAGGRVGIFRPVT